MNDGVLQQVGTPSDVYLYPANLFVAQFIGSPVMNIAETRVKEEAGAVSVRSHADGELGEMGGAEFAARVEAVVRTPDGEHSLICAVRTRRCSSSVVSSPYTVSTQSPGRLVALPRPWDRVGSP